MDPIFNWKGGGILSGKTANRPKNLVEIFAIEEKLQCRHPIRCTNCNEWNKNITLAIKILAYNQSSKASMLFTD